MNLIKSRNNVITYTVNKSEISNCYISVQNGEVLVSAPWYLTANQIQNMVEKKRQWILAKLKEYKTPTKINTNNKKGQTVKVLGKDYSFKIIYKNIKGPNINLENDKINITLPNKYKKSDLNTILKVLMEKVYFTLAEKEIDFAMEKARVTLGFAPEEFELQKMNGVLGRCTADKKIIINPDIVMFDRKVIEYVVLHEFCHLKYKNHSKKFYELLEKYLPDYVKYSKYINNYQY